MQYLLKLEHEKGKGADRWNERIGVQSQIKKKKKNKNNKVSAPRRKKAEGCRLVKGQSRFSVTGDRIAFPL